MSTCAKPEKRSNIAGDVDHFCYCRRAQKIKTEKPDKHEHQETARTRSEKSVIKTDGTASDSCCRTLTAADMRRRMQASKVLPLEGIDSNRKQDKWKEAPQKVGRNPCHGEGTGE